MLNCHYPGEPSMTWDQPEEYYWKSDWVQESRLKATGFLLVIDFFLS